MGKIGKPQKRKKNKIKSYGWYKNNDTVNRAPKSFEQEVPKRLRELGAAIKETQSGNRNRNKFKNRPDGPDSSSAGLQTTKKNKHDKGSKIQIQKQEPGEKKMGKQMRKMMRDATESYIDNLKPTRPLLENFKFKQRNEETEQQFLRRVEEETHDRITQSKIADKFDVNEKDTIKNIVKEKMVAKKREKRKQQWKEENEPFSNAEKKKKQEVKEFSSLQDMVAFGEVVHAPPVLSVLPKRATSQGGHDRPGLRMPELKEAFVKKPVQSDKDPVKRKKGESVKRKNLSIHQKFEADTKQQRFVEAYRQMKKKRKIN